MMWMTQQLNHIVTRLTTLDVDKTLYGEVMKLLENIMNECQAVGDLVEETGFISHMSDLETGLYNTLQDLLVDGSILPEMTMSFLEDNGMACLLSDSIKGQSSNIMGRLARGDVDISILEDLRCILATVLVECETVKHMIEGNAMLDALVDVVVYSATDKIEILLEENNMNVLLVDSFMQNIRGIFMQ